MHNRFILSAATAVAMALAVPAFGPLPAAAEQAAPAEKNPPGDIPDSQVFVAYDGPGFVMKVPEGWARTDQTAGAIFNDKYNRIAVSIVAAQTAPTVASVTNNEAKVLAANGRAIKLGSIKEVRLDGGRAIRLDYTANSDPNPVTNKQIRLEAVTFYLFGNGKLLTLDMSAPSGADNVDQWNLMANSLRIK